MRRSLDMRATFDWGGEEGWRECVGAGGSTRHSGVAHGRRTPIRAPATRAEPPRTIPPPSPSPTDHTPSPGLTASSFPNHPQISLLPSHLEPGNLLALDKAHDQQARRDQAGNRARDLDFTSNGLQRMWMWDGGRMLVMGWWR